VTTTVATPGALVVVPTAPQLGVCRFERVVDTDGASASLKPQARLFRYDTGDFLVVDLDDVAPCPPGVWDKNQPPLRR
jgi:hypothetical protein